MRILVFYQYFGTPKGSWSTRVYELTRRWVTAGHSVTVVTSPYEKSDLKTNSFIKKVMIDGIQVVIVDSADSNRDPFYKRVFRAIKFSLVSIYYSLSLSADVVIASSGPITIGVPGLIAKWFRGRKLVFEVRDLWPQGAIELGLIKSPTVIKVAKWFEALCYKNSSLVVPCSKGMEECVQQVAPDVPTLVIPNASDPALFHEEKVFPLSMPLGVQSKKIFLYAGSLGLMDDCAQIIHAMDFVKNESIALVFAGGGAEKSYLEDLANKSFNKNIFFLGLIPKVEVVKWFSISTATFVTFKDLKVLHTSSPNKMFDSFAAGKPIIQSTKGWIHELVEQEKCGINVDPHSPEEFAQAMNLLVNDSSLQEKLSRNSRRLAATIFNRDNLAAAYLKGLEQILDE